jgi:outer membrane protein assembly factor BamB
MRTISLLFLALVPVDSRAGTEIWPEFRGPTGDGQADAPVPLRWSERENVAWRTAIRGKGWSTPVVLGGQVWLTTASEDGKEMSAVCVDRASGRVLHDENLFRNESPHALGNPVNCYASPSPAIEAGRVYVGFGSYGTACLDAASFRTLWQRRDLPCNHFRGPASSLVLFEDLLITHMDGSDHQYVIALDSKTGATRWRVDRSTDFGDLGPDGRPTADGDFRKAFNTPLIVETAGKLQMLSPGAKAAFSYDPRTGRELWTVRYGNHSSASRTVCGEGLAFINTGYPKAELWAVRTDGEGDVTGTHVLWKSVRGIPNRSSPVLAGGLLFICSDRGIASCLEPRTGEEVWQERIGGDYSASPVHVAGRIYFFSEEGVTTVIRPGRRLEVLARNELGGGFMASPAIAGRELYLRTRTHLYRIEDPPP